MEEWKVSKGLAKDNAWKAFIENRLTHVQL